MVRCGSLLGTGGYGNNVLFLTGTLPGSTPEAFSSLASESSWAVHSLLTRIPRLAGLLPSECRWIWCWEYQARGALHWHCAIWLPTVAARDLVLRGFTQIWNSTLIGVQKRSGVDIFARGDGTSWREQPEVWRSSAEVLRKRADRYLAKYLSKENSKGDKNAFPPTRWYGISHSLHQELKEKTEYYSTRHENKTGHIVNEVEFNLIDWLDKNSYLGKIYSDTVGTGINGVYYLEDSKMDEAKRIFGEVDRSMELQGHIAKSGILAGAYPGLLAVQSRPWLAERYVNDLGAYYRKLYYQWLDDTEKPPEEELFWLEYYARRLCYTVGLNYIGQPPERSGVGLPGQDTVTIKTPPAPLESLDQSALFP